MFECRRCHESKDESCFTPDKRTRRGHGSYCRPCQNLFTRESFNKNRARNLKRAADNTRKYYRANPEKAKASSRRAARVTSWQGHLVSASRCLAKKHSYDFDLTREFIEELWEKQKGRCYWTAVPLKAVDVQRHPQRPSLDRLDCNKGYTRDNVVLASQFANMGRSTTSPEAFEKFLTLLTDSLNAKAEPVIDIVSMCMKAA